MRNRTFAVALAGVLVAAIAVVGQDYPQWRGPKRDGHSAETGLLKTWPEGGPKMLWSVSGLGQGFSTVTVADGLIYVTGMVGREGTLFAFDLEGKEKWKVTYGPEWAGSHPGTRTTPTVDDGLLYLISGMGRVLCLDAKTGKEKWSVDTAREFGGQNIAWGISESPLVFENKVICHPGGPDAAIVALDKKTGKTVWKSEGLGDKSGYCSPILVSHGGKKLLLSATEIPIVGLEAETGKVLWKVPWRNQYKVNANTPIYLDGMIFFTSGYGKGSVGLRLSEDGSSVSEAWTVKALDVHHGGAVLVDGCVYAASSKGEWMCVDIKSGQVKWTAGGVGKGSVAYADGMLYCYGERGTVALVKATPAGYEAAGSFKVTQGSGSHWAHPVVAGGRLYIRHGNALMAFDVKGK